MFNASFNKAILSTLAAAIVATSVSVTPSYAGGGRDPVKKASTISSTNPDGSTTSIFSKKGANTYTVKRTKNGKLLNLRVKNKKSAPWVSTRDANGKLIIIRKPKKPGKAFIEMRGPDGKVTRADKVEKRGDFVTRHFPNGQSVTIKEPSKPGKAFITMHNADGSTTTVGDR